MKNILITGGAGFIGSEIVNQLYRKGGWEIIVLRILLNRFTAGILRIRTCIKKLKINVNLFKAV